MREFPIDVEAKRGAGNYAAVLSLRDDGKYGGVQRDFLDGKRVKTRGTIEYGSAAFASVELPVWVERGEALDTAHCPTCKCRKPRDLIAVYASGWETVAQGLTTDDLRVIVGSAPGEFSIGQCVAGHLLVDTAPDACPVCRQTLEALERAAAERAAAPVEDPF